MEDRPYSMGNSYHNTHLDRSGRTVLGNVHGSVYFGDAKSTTKFLKLFRTSQYENHKARNQDRVEGTCKWFLTHHKFVNWKNGASGLLWFSADPGCGKSVLSRSLIDNELHKSETRITCYFFFKDDNEEQQTCTKALCALLHQLFSQRPGLLKYAESACNANKEEDIITNFHLLWEIFTTAAADPEAGDVICVLDALDECRELERRTLLEALCAFYYGIANENGDVKLKFLVTSRPYHNIEIKFAVLIQAPSSKRLAGEKNMDKVCKDIELVIDANVNHIKQAMGLDENVISSLRDELSRYENRTYLWLKLVFDLLSEDLASVTKKGREQIFGKIPSTVDAAYTTILNSIKNKEQARKLLSIICAATRPLSVREMSIALAIELHHVRYDDLDIQPDEFSAKYIRNLCGLFVSVIDGKIYLLHQTAKEFLLSQDSIGLTPSLSSTTSWKHSITTRDSNQLLALICIQYLLLAELGNNKSFRGRNYGPYLISAQRVDQTLQPYNFLEYSATNWPAHFRLAAIQQDQPAVDLALKIYNSKSHHFVTWFSVYRYKRNYVPQVLDVLHLASLLGHEGVLGRLLDMPGINANIQDRIVRTGRTPLFYAARGGHVRIIMLLLEKLGNQIKLTKDIVRAAANGRKGDEVITLLLNRPGADVPITVEIVATIAGKFGKEVMSSLLDRHTVDVHITEQVVTAAAKNFNSETMKLLLDRRGEDVHTTEQVVIAAAKNSNSETIKLLLDRRGEDFLITEQVVIAAATNYKSDTMKLLLDQRGPDVHITEQVVIAATTNSETMKLLLDQRGPDVHITEEVVIAAATNYMNETMKLLLDQRGPDVHITEEVVIAAASNQYNGTKVLTLLFDRHGKDIPITEQVMVVAASSQYRITKLFTLLLDRCGNDIPITEQVMVAAVSNQHEATKVFTLLLDRRGKDIPITEQVMVAAASNKLEATEVFTLLLDRRGNDIPITEQVMVAAASNELEVTEVFTLLLDRRGNDIPITEQVMVAAASNELEATEVFTLLLNRRGKDIPITEQVLIAAMGNPFRTEAIIRLLFNQCRGDISITKEVMIAAERSRNSKEMVRLLLEYVGEDVFSHRDKRKKLQGSTISPS